MAACETVHPGRGQVGGHARCAAAGITIGALLLNRIAGAQTTGLSVAPSSDIKAVRATKPPVIDGEVGDIEWEGAATATSFIQYEPRRGDRSDVRTEALMLHDAGHLYVAFRAWDAEPITAQLTQRDADLFRDDAVAVVIDTTFDRRSGYYFITNALGTQADGRIADDGRTADSTWDAPWESAARRTDYGWSAEFSIPLSSIRYVAGENRTWGINFGRSRRRTLELSFWSGPLDSQWRVSQAGRLVGLTVSPPLDRIQVVPFGLMRAGGRRGASPGSRHRRPLRPDAHDRGLRHPVSGLRHDRGGPGTGQPDTLRALPSRETPVLPRGPGAVQPAVSNVLLTQDYRYHRGREAARQAGTLDDGVDLGAGRRSRRGPASELHRRACAARRLRPIERRDHGGEPAIRRRGRGQRQRRCQPVLQPNVRDDRTGHQELRALRATARRCSSSGRPTIRPPDTFTCATATWASTWRTI